MIYADSVNPDSPIIRRNSGAVILQETVHSVQPRSSNEFAEKFIKTVKTVSS
jgi:hypothetical protein